MHKYVDGGCHKKEREADVRWTPASDCAPATVEIASKQTKDKTQARARLSVQPSHFHNTCGEEKTRLPPPKACQQKTKRTEKNNKKHTQNLKKMVLHYCFLDCGVCVQDQKKRHGPLYIIRYLALNSFTVFHFHFARSIRGLDTHRRAQK